MSDEVDRASEHTHWRCVRCANVKTPNVNKLADEACVYCKTDRQPGAAALDKDLNIIGQLDKTDEKVWAWNPKRLR
ncbi:hypothetical protein FVEG_14604 [Fusarium verticillioides 7600]|uniref:RanBP2-type domain-containing protein n=1 Tax=Gibberella moniliformis (strain M3125 / FGSC 7600) TaxID=334819 RepID=W7LKD8_GIBM7|nr:hypothetical protein FVEG_14604 [Fusarium verticillioides 7600]EWG36005.1 hypothetical protein FVEG_14604 [Fusarium verticillioides 7600]